MIRYVLNSEFLPFTLRFNNRNYVQAQNLVPTSYVQHVTQCAKMDSTLFCKSLPQKLCATDSLISTWAGSPEERGPTAVFDGETVKISRNQQVGRNFSTISDRIFFRHLTGPFPPAHEIGPLILDLLLLGYLDTRLIKNSASKLSTKINSGSYTHSFVALFLAEGDVKTSYIPRCPQ